MKKILALVLCAVMVLSMIPALALTSSAAAEGDWITRRSPGEYKKEIYRAAPGYMYDAEGFHTVGGDYKDTHPNFRVTSKEAWDLMNNEFTMTVRIDDFAYKGEKGYDEWFSFNVMSVQDCAPAYLEDNSGIGFISLHRGNGDGSSNFEAYAQTAQVTRDDGSIQSGVFGGTGTANIDVPMDDQGRELYTLTIKYDGDYHIFVNDVEAPGMSTISNKMKEGSAEGMFYIGITIQTGAPDTTCGVSIIDVNGTVPQGSDSAEPEENKHYKAPIADSSTIPEGQPCLLWDSTGAITTSAPGQGNCTLIPQGDGSWAVQADVANSVYFNFGPKGDLSYEAQDFPVIAMMMKDYWGNDGAYWYAAGDVLGAKNDCRTTWSQSDDNAAFYGPEEEYVFICADLTGFEDYVGRINDLRVEFSIDCTDSDMNAWYMNWVGYFRTVDDAKAYAEAWIAEVLAQSGDDQPTAEAGDDATEAPADDATEAPADDATEAPAADTEAPATEAPAADATEAPAADATDAPAADATDAPAADEGGCASVIGCVAIIMTAIAAAFVCKKH